MARIGHISDFSEAKKGTKKPLKNEGLSVEKVRRVEDSNLHRRINARRISNPLQYHYANSPGGG